ncbi:hypothetical protein BT96DRAFT_994741 [Gymnopus androsaceus JB14]|uniref:Uncharacterized protein n=1 Tax=Gymnopus androsaceus JB14 TaxID=1447944 RepID=A0A6A4HLF1_9AGAR|nr:hypothetical protein BT96DRAFT_994741 [Gymnopus androsaceus JB14]
MKKDFGKKAIKVSVSATTLIVEALDLKEVIQCFKWDTEHQSLHPTDLQKARLLDRGFSILSQMDAFFEAQRLHMPHAVILHDKLNAKPGNSALWNIPLLLPSEIINHGGTCSKTLLDIEWCLRYAYCHDSLEQMQKHLLSRTGLIAYKLKYLHGQYNGTRSSQTVNAISTKINACATKYRVSFAMVDKHAKAVGCVASGLRKLNPEDIRGIERNALHNQWKMDVTLSWIWYAMGVNFEDDEAVHDNLRISWCKALARAHQWQEECLLIQEEMRWLLVTFEKQALEWERRSTNSWNAQFRNMTPEVIEGCAAYTARQTSLRRNLAVFCQSKWLKVLQELAMGPRGIALDNSEYILA